MKKKLTLKSKPITPSFEGELIKLGGKGMQKYDASIADKLSSSTFLPRLQLITGNSAKGKDGSFPINKFALITGQEYKDVGGTVDILCLVWRPKAIDTGSDEMIISHDIDDKEFQRIKADSLDKTKSDSGCMYGQEFLVYIPSEEQFATFFMGTPTSRREAPNLLALLQKAATLKPAKIKTPKYEYFSPSVVMCSTKFKLPSEADCLAEVEKFNNPSVQKVERVETKEGETVRG